MTLTQSSAGQLSTTRLGNISTQHSYDAYGSLVSFSANLSANSGNGSVYSESLTYNTLGQISGKTETLSGVTHTSAYSYDAMGRLSAFSDGTKTESYTYDAQGNLINTSNGETASGTYDAQDRIQTWSTSGTLSRSGDIAFSYDILGNLKSVTVGANTYSYVVDGNNRRIAKRTNGALQKGWLYQNGLNPVAELDNQNRVIAQFIYAEKGNVPSSMRCFFYCSR